MARIELQVDGPVARITLNRPQRHNALTVDSISSFLRHLDRMEQDSSLRVLLITGAGDRAFCSGLALEQLHAGDVGSGTFEALADRLSGLALPKIAAMNGSAYGGGAEIALCCDFRFGVEGMRLRIPAAQFGLCYPPSGVQRYVDRLGVGAAKRLLAAAETLDAQELLHIGFLQRVCAPGELQAAAGEFADSIAALGPLAVRAMLRLCDGAATGTLAKGEAQRLVEACNRSDDLREGLQAAMEKRQPKFRGI